MTPSHDRELRHFRSLTDLTGEELLALLDRGIRVKAGDDGTDRPLAGRTLAMIFRKSSTRTRVSFEVGMHQLGGHAVFLADRDSQMGRGEPIADTARVLSGYVDGIMIRTFAQAEVDDLAEHATIPVINGLTDLLHPCQILADLMTIREEFPGDVKELTVAWIGDGNNMANSWLNAAALLGFELRLAMPGGFDPDPGILSRAREATRVFVTREPREAVEGAHAVNTDVWASMGQEEEARARMEKFRPFQVNEELMEAARSEAIFLHCLPAHRGEEVTAGVIDGPWSRVFQEAENRLHAQKALMLELMAP
jgi:ornithine carbamoyltransferase